MDDNVSTTIPIQANYGANPDYWDALKPWLPLVHRLQDAGKSRGHSVVTVHIVVDEFGRPLHWGKPKIVHIEPLSRGEALDELLQTLAE